LSINQTARNSALVVLIASLFTLVSCSRLGLHSESSSANGKNASITADPNPIRVCDGSAVGVTRLSWTAIGPKQVEVHVSSPDGVLFAQTAPTSSAETGKWVTNGMSFYLQDVSDGKPLTAENTLATISVKVTSDGCH
jgi:hypothetical protein